MSVIDHSIPQLQTGMASCHCILRLFKNKEDEKWCDDLRPYSLAVSKGTSIDLLSKWYQTWHFYGMCYKKKRDVKDFPLGTSESSQWYRYLGLLWDGVEILNIWVVVCNFDSSFKRTLTSDPPRLFKKCQRRRLVNLWICWNIFWNSMKCNHDLNFSNILRNVLFVESFIFLLMKTWFLYLVSLAFCSLLFCFLVLPIHCIIVQMYVRK